MYCTNCGNKLNDGADICTSCGKYIKNQPSNVEVDEGGFIWGLVGFLVPVVGLVLYISWKNNKPKSSKSAGIGALIGFCINFVVSIFTIIINFAILA